MKFKAGERFSFASPFFVFLLLIIFPLNAYGVRKDLSPLEALNLWKKLSTHTRSFSVFSYKTFSSQHFTIYYGADDPATTLWADYNKNGVPDFVENTASILEQVWNVEINEMGFQKPLGSLPIPVYIANTGIYLNGNELVLSDDICGFSVFDGESSAIVINATPPYSPYTKPMDMLKVTLAHEFFHLVQYSYRISTDENDLWLYEGTAVWMENQVYPEINDYIYSYADTLFNSPEYGITYPKGLFPYSSSLFFDFISQKFGKEIIKEIWKEFQTAKTSIDAIKNVLKEKGSSFEKELYSFYVSLGGDKTGFSDKDELQDYQVEDTPVPCNVEKKIEVYPAGSIFLDTDCQLLSGITYSGYLLVSGNETEGFNLKDADTTTPVPVVFLPQESDKSGNVTVKAVDPEQELDLKEGWNLTGFKSKVTTELFNLNGIVSLWKWTDGSWKIYVPDYLSDLKLLVEKYGVDSFSDIYPKEGVWIKCSSNLAVSLPGEVTENFSLNLKSGWNLVSFPLFVDIDLEKLSEAFSFKYVWKWNDGKWQIFIPPQEEELKELVESYGIETFNKIEGENYEGFWIKTVE